MSFIKSSRPRSPNSLPNSTERLDLARRLHDGLAQELAALGYAMDSLIADPRLAQELRAEMRSLRLRLIAINANFRDEIYLLRHFNFDSLSRACDDLFGAIDLRINLPKAQLAPAAEDALARALLEIARNSAKHSGCAQFSIESQIHNNLLEIVASDNGIGAISTRERSFGLASITEHLTKIGAGVECIADQSGTRYIIQFDLTKTN